MTDQGIFPYAGTSGWAGSETSYLRAVTDDETGETTKRQKQAIRELLWASRHGLTWKELAMNLNLHHGQASGVLSVLHKAGRIERLKERRNKCSVYVLTEFVHGRVTESHGNTKANLDNNKIVSANKFLEQVFIDKQISIYAYETLKAILND